MHWTIAAPFIDRQNIDTATWLEQYVSGERHQFTLIPREIPLESWHERKSKFTNFKEWLVYWRQGTNAIQATEGV